MKFILLFPVFLSLISCSNREIIRNNHSSHEISFSKNGGTSFNEAVVVNGVSSPEEGFAAEYQYISNLHGQRGQDWFLVGQTIFREKAKIVDVVEIQLKNPPDRRVFFFDASTFVSAQ